MDNPILFLGLILIGLLAILAFRSKPSKESSDENFDQQMPINKRQLSEVSHQQLKQSDETSKQSHEHYDPRTRELCRRLDSVILPGEIRT